MQRERRTEKLPGQKIREPWDNFKRCNTDVIGKAEEGKKSLKESGKSEPQRERLRSDSDVLSEMIQTGRE